MKNITLDILLDRKLKHDTDAMKIVPFESKVLDGTIEIVKGKARDILKMADDAAGSSEEALRSNLKLIYKHCPIFQNKELQEVYEVVEPYDIVLEVFEQNLGEINRLANAIMNIYGMGEQIANEELDSLKN